MFSTKPAGEPLPTLIAAHKPEQAGKPLLMDGVGQIAQGSAIADSAVQDFLAYVAGCPLYVRDIADGLPHDEPGVMRIPLTNTDGVFALIDAEDYDLLKRYKWRLHETRGEPGYAVASCQVGPRNHAIYMHRLVLMLLGASGEVDHKNLSKLDNRKTNLRACTHAENSKNLPTPSTNTSGFKGVIWSRGKAVGTVVSDGRVYRKGFDTAEAANAWAVRTRAALHGEFACHGAVARSPHA
jgi:hypothetical protein